MPNVDKPTIIVGEHRSSLTAHLNGNMMEIIRGMPGFKKWKDRVLVFESSAANLRYLRNEIKDAVFIDEKDRMKALAKAEHDEKKARELKKKSLPPEAAKSFPFVKPPYKHQLKAFTLYKDTGSKISPIKAYGLFFDMGTGKTKTDLDITAYKWGNGEIDCKLIFCWPSLVHQQWAEEAIPEHMPKFVQYVVDWYRPSKRNRIYKNAALWDRNSAKLRILTMNIESLSSASGREMAMAFVKSGRCMVTIDESFTIKTPGSARTKAAFKLRDLSVCRSIMTGTPNPEGLEDIWAQMNFLDPDILGYDSFYTFRNRYCEVVPAYRGAPMGAVKIVSYRNVKELWEKVDAHCMRVLEEDCLDLPKRRYITRYVDPTDEQVRLYNEMADRMAFASQTKKGGVIKADEVIVRMMMQQRILCGAVPTYTWNGEDELKKVEFIPSNRAKAVVDWWEECNREQMVVWGRFHTDLDLLTKEFEARGATVVRYDGTVKKPQRAENKQLFIKGKADILLGTQASGGTGLDGLQVCRYVGYYSNSPASLHRTQSERRTHRSGMKGSCLYADFVVKGTIDEEWIKLLKDKKDVAGYFLDDPNGWKKLAARIAA